jgi:hypothetical protein
LLIIDYLPWEYFSRQRLGAVSMSFPCCVDRLPYYSSSIDDVYSYKS